MSGVSNISSIAARLSLGEDVKNNAAYANTVVVGTQSYAYASAFSSTACTAAQLGPYLNGWKNLTFSRNTYSRAISHWPVLALGRLEVLE